MHTLQIKKNLVCFPEIKAKIREQWTLPSITNFNLASSESGDSSDLVSYSRRKHNENNGDVVGNQTQNVYDFER